MTDITFEQACDDRCLEKLVPSDLRQLVAERDRLVDEAEKRDELIAELVDALNFTRVNEQVIKGALKKHRAWMERSNES